MPKKSKPKTRQVIAEMILVVKTDDDSIITEMEDEAREALFALGDQYTDQFNLTACEVLVCERS